jgi:hypothetical protein
MGQIGWVLLGGLLTAAGLATVPVVRWAIRSRPFALVADADLSNDLVVVTSDVVVTSERNAA